MTYTIEKNAQFGSLEVYFSDKPSQMIRDALKLLRFRWHSVKKCWYGFSEENTLRETLCTASADQNDVVVTDGYMGAIATYGTKSNRRLYGADLSAAIRREFKSAGLKGVTVKCSTYSGGQHLYVTVKTTGADFVSREDYIRDYEPRPVCGWIDLGPNDRIHESVYYSAEGDQENLRRAAAEHAYRLATSGAHSLNEHYLEHCTEFVPATLEKLQKINEIVSAYRYNDSNGMVDYFNTNFYYDISIKPAKA